MPSNAPTPVGGFLLLKDLVVKDLVVKRMLTPCVLAALVRVVICLPSTEKLFIYIYIYSKLQTELFRPVGPHQCSAETWERLKQMRTFMPSLVLHVCGRENTMPCQSAQTTEVASFA